MSERRSVSRPQKTLRALVLAIGLLAVAGCDDSSGPLELQYWAAESVAAPDQVRLVAGGRMGQTMTIEVVIDGPTSSNDLSTFDFGVRIGNDSIVEWIPGSESLGPALDATGCADLVLLATPRDGDIAVTVSKIGCPGNAVLAAGTVLMSFDVRVLRGGATTVRLGPVPANDPPVALDSVPAPVSSIVFDRSPITVFGL